LLTLEEGKFLVKLARQTIEGYLRTGKKPQAPKVGAKFQGRRGVFVTLTKDGELRGCIGHPLPTMLLVEAVIDAAISSATRDPRFPPVGVDEMHDIKLEVSVLSEPEIIKVKNPREYPKCIVIGRDGLIVELSGCAGLLLPQVPAEYGWDAEEFLSHACMKAGLMPDYWLQKGVCISKFSAQIFAEKSPGGEVEERVFNVKN
jgi:uncharacterized protein (TIGR00296 family)